MNSWEEEYETWIRFSEHVFRLSKVSHFYMINEGQLRVNLDNNDFILISEFAKQRFDFLNGLIFEKEKQ